MTDLADQIRELLAGRDRQRAWRMFNPRNAIEADTQFVAAMVEVVQEYAEGERERIRAEVRRLQAELAEARAATPASGSARSPVRATAPRKPASGKGGTAQGRTGRSGDAT